MSYHTKTLKIDGMTCVNCAINVEKSVKAAGVENAHVNFANKELVYEDNHTVPFSSIESAIKKAGYSVHQENKSNKFFDQLITYFCFLVAIYFMGIMFFHNIHIPPYVDLILASISLLIGFYKFGKGAFYSLVSGSANMHVLILFGAFTAYVFSIYLMIFKPGAHLYFEATAVLIALVIVGNILEDNAIKKTVSSLTQLAQNKVSQAKKIVDGTVVLSSVNSLKIGDLVQANLGDEILTDAIVKEGEALVDESLISGESIPITKKIGDVLLGGSQIIEGNIAYEVTKSTHLSTKAKISKLVQDASTKKANVQKLADKISAIFVPLIFAIAILSFFINFYALQVGLEASLIRSVAVLVVSCPCAMGLATPIAVMVGIGKMSEKGILAKTPDVFENFAHVEKIIFDKTGTLTTGNFKVDEIICNNINEKEAKEIIKSIESKSSHPIAKSIVKEWNAVDIKSFKTIEEVKAKGMKALDNNGDEYLFGSASFTAQDSIKGDLFLLKNNALVASLKISDELKSDVKPTVEYFKSNNVNPIVLSGDKNSKCLSLSKNLDTKVIGELKPEDKLEIINSYANENTAMLGDGINDAPSLAKVNVGISFADASNMAMQSADLILMKDDMNNLVKSHKIAKATYKTIKQNLFWAFAYNIVVIPMAIMGLINPMLAAFIMIFSDLVVVGNAFLLKLKKI